MDGNPIVQDKKNGVLREVRPKAIFVVAEGARISVGGAWRVSVCHPTPIVI
jgi:hypothetical protein